jgi:hypothetical protein
MQILVVYGRVMTPCVSFLYVSLYVDRILLLGRDVKSDYQIFAGSEKNMRYMYVSFISNLHLSNISKIIQAPVLDGIFIVGNPMLKNYSGLLSSEKDNNI